jgi:simple sugar transport system ATP-binding protein
MPFASLNIHDTSLQMSGISKTYGPARVLAEVSLSIRSGEVVALMGANGAGKSTLAKVASGAVQPDTGQILVAGRELKFASPQAARSHGIVIVHQATDQLGVPGLSVAENLVLDELCLGNIGRWIGKRRLLRRAQAIASGIGLDLPLDRDFGELGPAHRQLIAIARAAAAKAFVLIFDEPTASLGANEAARLFQVIDRLRSQGVGILYISHRLADLQRLADRLVILRNGQIVAEQTRPLDFAAAIRAMIGRDLQGAGGAHPVAGASKVVVRLEAVQLTPRSEPFDFSIRAGEIVAVTGVLGSGKSRLLGALFGLTRIVAGEIFLHGQPWRPSGPAAAIRNGVFMAGEERWRSSLLPPGTPGADIAGAIALPHRRRWFPFGLVRQSRERSVAARSIAKFGIRCGGSADTLDLLSGGNQQKVVLARWQAAPCQLLLLDEPFQGVDIGARRDLITAIRSAGRQTAILVATNDIEEAVEVADLVAVIRKQTVVGLYDLQHWDTTSLKNAIRAAEAEEIGSFAA